MGRSGGVGWLFALADKQMGAAINAMHDAPARPWTLHELAQRAGMSRSGFAQKFKQAVGEPPMEYLTRWRMLLAGGKLVNTGDSISVIARSLGYLSESAFSTAFQARHVLFAPRIRPQGRPPATSRRLVARRVMISRFEKARALPWTRWGLRPQTPTHWGNGEARKSSPISASPGNDVKPRSAIGGSGASGPSGSRAEPWPS
ncbi:MAG: helix-turn-helix transcriptional regulator [Rhodospirillales bacterium]